MFYNYKHLLLLLKKNDSLYLLAVLFSCFAFFLLSNNFKVCFVLSLIFCILFFLITKNLLSSVFTVFIISSSFLLPGKLYVFEIASPSQYSYEFQPDGIFDNFGLYISDIYAFWILLIFLSKSFHSNSLKKSFKNNIFFKKLILYPIVFWLVYIVISLYSSAYYSFYPSFSLIITIQSLKILISYITIVYLYFYKHKNFTKLEAMIMGILIFVCSIGILQFLKILPNSIDISLSVPPPEEAFGVQRISGVLGHANPHAFFISLLFLIFLAISQKKSKVSSISTFLVIINIFLSQSRVIWLSWVIIGLIYFFFYKRSGLDSLKIVLKNKLRLAIVLIFTTVIVIPRLSLTRFFFSEYGGGSLRKAMLIQGGELLRENPIIGYGVGTGVNLFFDKLPHGYIETFPHVVHFAFMQLALESGIIASFSFFVPYYIYLKSALQKKVLRNKRINLFTSCILMIFFYYSLQPINNSNRQEFVLLGLVLGLANSFLYKDIYESS